MAIQTDRSRPGDAGAGVTSRVPATLSRIAGRLVEFGKWIADYAGDFTRRIGLYEFLTYGPLIRLVAKTLLRRIIFANMIGLVILLSGIVYLSQYHAWLIEAKRDSLRAQGEVIAAAIAANATREKDTGRIVLNPDMLPEVEGERSLLRDENIAAMQLSIPPDRVAPLFKGGLLPSDIRARAARGQCDNRSGSLVRLFLAGLAANGNAGSKARPHAWANPVRSARLRPTVLLGANA